MTRHQLVRVVLLLLLHPLILELHGGRGITEELVLVLLLRIAACGLVAQRCQRVVCFGLDEAQTAVYVARARAFLRARFALVYIESLLDSLQLLEGASVRKQF